MFGPLFLRFWPHALAGLLFVALSAVGLRACSLDRSNAVLSTQMTNEKSCTAPSYCAQAVTKYERDTAQNATAALQEAIANAGKAAAELQKRRAEIEDTIAAERRRARAVLEATQRQLEEAIARDPACKDWLEQPVTCPLTDPRELWSPDPERGGFIDRSGGPSSGGVSGDPAPADGAAVPQPDEASSQR